MELLPFFLAEVLMALYAYMVAYKEITAVRMMREYVPTPNPFNEPFHFYGYMMAVPMGIAVTVLQLLHPSWKAFILTPLVSMTIYWAVFNWKLSSEVWGNWKRVGDSSWFDRTLKAIFKEDVETKTVMLQCYSFVLFNALYIIL